MLILIDTVVLIDTVKCGNGTTMKIYSTDQRQNEFTWVISGCMISSYATRIYMIFKEFRLQLFLHGFLSFLATIWYKVKYAHAQRNACLEEREVPQFFMSVYFLPFFIKMTEENKIVACTAFSLGT